LQAGLENQIQTVTEKACFLDPQKYIREESLRKIEQKMDIAAEIFIARNQAIHYSDLMPVSSASLASKTKLISWLNDYQRRGKMIRPGLIRLYQIENSHHFKNGKWETRNLALFVDFVLSKLTDSRCEKRKKSADLFLDSIQEEEWYWQAVSLMATKFLEHLYYTSSLKSKTAYALIDCTLKNRLMLEKMGKLFGRIAKNNEMNSDWTKSLKTQIKNFLKEQIKIQLEVVEQHGEYTIFKEYEQAIKDSLNRVRQEICSKEELLFPAAGMLSD